MRSLVMQTMQNLAHSLDSTRKCTAAINGAWGGTGFATVIDVVGFNYNMGSLDSVTTRHPTDNIIGTERGPARSRAAFTRMTPPPVTCASYDIANPGELDLDGGNLVAILLCPSLVFGRVLLDRL
jgi:hypothetical protein